MDTATERGPQSWADLAVGDPPRIPYVDGHRYVVPGGEDLALPRDGRGVSGAIPFSGGLLVSDAAYFEGTNGVALVEDGSRMETWPSGRHCSSGTPAASADGSYAAWVTVRCPESEDMSIGAVHRAHTDGSAEKTQPIGFGLASVAGFLGHRVVYNRGFEDGAWISDFQDEPAQIPGVERVHDVSPRFGWLIAERGDRTKLVIDADGTVRWRLRAGDLDTFSPGGAKVLALGPGRQISVLDASNGATTARLDPPAGVDVHATVWESDRTLLTLLAHRGQVAVVRFHLDGHLERTTRPVHLVDGRSQYTLLPR